YGYSVTNRGYVAQLSDRYTRKFDVLNRGYSGYNTDMAKILLPQLLSITRSDAQCDSTRLRLLTIFFGANDAALPGSAQHVPLNRYRENLRYLIELVTCPDSDYYSPDTHIVLIAPPPVGEKMWGNNKQSKGQELDRKNQVTREYAQAVVEVGEEMRIPVVDLWKEIMHRWEKLPRHVRENDWDGFDQFTVDGLHLNANGYQILTELLVEIIERNWVELRADNIELECPPWWELETESNLAE
ncbi:isoamyl acetate-hydrolyzing esterase, partial [Spiromyces aspiralis]